MQVHFLVQSGFVIQHANKTIGIDVRLQNPAVPYTVDDMPRFDYLFLTHDHGDHGMADMIQLAQRDGCPLIANVEAAKKAHSLGVSNAISCAMGGEFALDETISVYATRAIHSSETGFPMGYIIRIADKIIYHMGDTEYFSDLQIYRERYDIDLLLAPMGARYTMGPREAAYATRDIAPKHVIPIHYNLSDKTAQNPDDFTQRLAKLGVQTQTHFLQFGQDLQLT